MKQLTILSGKGGTGKTTIAAAFAVLAKNTVIADCDVDAPDLHMLLHPTVVKTQEFKGAKLAVIDEERCTKCGECREKCRFDAIAEDIKIDSIACEGCGVCVVVCPVDAISLIERISGHAYISETEHGSMAHAMLNPGEGNSGKLVTLVRQNARVLANKERSNLIVVDGSPGIGCPVIASVTGVDAGLAVAEPTMSGIHDLERALELLKHFSVPSFVCVNKYDINRDNADRIVSYCRDNGIEVVGRIPFDPVVTKAMVHGESIVDFAPESDVAEEIEKMWEEILSGLKH